MSEEVPPRVRRLLPLMRGPRALRPAAQRPTFLRRRLWRVLAVAVVAVAALLGVAGPASAHATLNSSNPTPNAILAKAPAAVTLTFDEGVSTVPGSLRVLGPDGSRADAGVVHQSGDGSNISVDLRDATKKGSYFVSWRVVSADSHPVSGAFTFAVGTTSAAPAAATAGSDGGSPVAIVLGASRWAGYVSLVLLLGGAVFLSVCWPAGWGQRRARRVLTLGWGVGLAAALLGLLVKGPYDAGVGLGQVGRTDLLSEVLGTAYGQALVVRFLLLGAIAIWLARRARTHENSGSPGMPARLAGLLVAAALLATFSATGHAAAGSGRALAFASDMSHLAAMSVWVGGLIMLAAVLLPLNRLPETARAVPRFSRMAAVAVAVLVVTGTYQAWRQVGSLPALTATTYGQELLVKVTLVAVAVTLGAGSRFWVRRHYPSRPVVVHAASASDVRDADLPPVVTGRPVTPAALRGLRRSVVSEAVIAVLVLAITSSLVATAPAKTAYHPSVAANLRFGPDTAQLSAVPSGDRAMDMHLFFFGPEGQPSDPQEVKATLRLPSQDLGPLPVTLQSFGDGHDIADIAVPVTGDWTLTISARTSAIDEFDQSVTLPIR